jgi:regulator of replication initiation timing
MALPLQKPKEKSAAAPAPAAGQSMKEPAHPPQVDGFKIKGKMIKGKPKDLANVLRSISFLEVAPEKELLNVLYIESRDIDKNPYLFSIMKIKEDEVEVIYTIPPEIGPKKRRVDVIRYILNILSLMENYYQVDNKTLYQLIENSIRELAGSVTMEYTKLYTAYDSMKKEVDDYKKKIERLNEQVQALTSQNYELKNQNDEMRLRVSQLEGLSDEALKAKLQEWVAEHSNSINISEFTKLYKVSDARVEEMLNRLVNEGYLEVIQ